jgi:hypothetical protein
MNAKQEFPKEEDYSRKKRTSGAYITMLATKKARHK